MKIFDCVYKKPIISRLQILSLRAKSKYFKHTNYIVLVFKIFE